MRPMEVIRSVRYGGHRLCTLYAFNSNEVIIQLPDAPVLCEPVKATMMPIIILVVDIVTKRLNAVTRSPSVL